MLSPIQSLCFRGEHEPTRPALAYEHAWLTYGQLLDSVARYATRLRAVGRGPRDTLAIAMPNGPEAVVAQLAGLWTGMTTVLLPLACPPDEMRYYLNDSRARVLTVLGTDVDWAKDLIQGTLARVGVVELLSRPDPSKETPFEGACGAGEWIGAVKPVADAPSCLVYTQQGSHAPCAAELSPIRVTLRGHLAAQLAGLRPTDVILSTAPNHGAGGLSLGIHAPVCIGAALRSMHWDGALATRLALDTANASVWVCVASQLLAFHRATGEMARPRALRQIVVAGAPLAARALLAIERELAVEIALLPGPAEVFPFARGSVEGDTPATCRVVHARSPFAHWHIASDATGQALPAGEPGWLRVGGVAVADGYRDRPDLSQQSRDPGGVWALALEGRLDANDRLLDLKPMVGGCLPRDEDVLALDTPNALFKHPAVLDALLVVTWNAVGMPVVWACVESTEGDAETLWETAQRATSNERFTIDRICIFTKLPRTQTGMRSPRKVREVLERFADTDGEICHWAGDRRVMPRY